MDRIENADMIKKGDDITADVFDFEDLKTPIPDNATLNTIAINRLLLNLRPSPCVKDADANNAAKLVMTYTKALVGQKEENKNTVIVLTEHESKI